MAGNTELRKQYMSLVRNIKSFSDGQAYLVPSEEEEDTLAKLTVAIAPNDGLYEGGTFKFKIELSDDYPHIDPPTINCLTRVYHPNIDVMDDYSDGSICLNLMDELWTPELTLEDYVQGLLFMFHNPNVDDPLSPVFGNGDDDEENYAENVRRSMRGEEVDGYDFDWVLDVESDEGSETPPKEEGVVKDDATKTTSAPKEDVPPETTPINDKDSALEVASETRDEATGQEIAEMTSVVAKVTAPTLVFPWQPLRTWTVRTMQFAVVYVAVRAGVSLLVPALTSVLFRTRYNVPVR